MKDKKKLWKLIAYTAIIALIVWGIFALQYLREISAYYQKAIAESEKSQH